MCGTRWLKKLFICGIAVLVVGVPAVVAAPPGPIDGQNIPTNFGAGTLLATQENKTGFGDQTVTPGGLTSGTELDALYLATTGDALKVGITGNLDPPNHVHIFIGNTGDASVGQDELKAQGVGGPPTTIQNMSQLVMINTSGTPGDPSDDFCEVTSNGTILPCVADYAISLDTFGGNLSVSEYQLLSDSNGFFDCGGADSPTFAVRTFVTQTTIADTNGMATNDQGFGYIEIGIDNSNVVGVTDTEGSSAAALTATTGIEMTIPFARLGVTGTETISVLVTLTGDAGFFSAQMLPSHPTCTTEGDRPDLSGLGNCLDVDLSTLAAWSGGANDSDGIVDPADYGGSVATVQTDCPTDFGDQQVDPDGVTLTGGSELNQLFTTNDDEFLYVGLTGNLESNGNGLMLFIDSITGGQGSVAMPLDVPDGGTRVVGMTGSVLPFAPDDTELLYDYVYEINGSLDAGAPATDATYFVDFTDIGSNSVVFLGSNNVNSNGSEFASDPANSNGFTFAYNFLNDAGVIGCGDGEACDLESNATIAARAVTSTFGFEFAIPLVDIGLEAADLPLQAKLFAFVTNGDGGFGSNQALPTLRDPTGAIPGSPSNCVENAGGSPQSPSINFSNDGEVGFCSLFPPDDPDCQYAFFARAACGCVTGAACPAADVNCDGIADGFDIADVRNGANWLLDTVDAADPRADVNGDGVIDGFDIADIRNGVCWLL